MLGGLLVPWRCRSSLGGQLLVNISSSLWSKMQQSERDQCWLFILLEDMAPNDYFITLFSLRFSLHVFFSLECLSFVFISNCSIMDFSMLVCALYLHICTRVAGAACINANRLGYISGHFSCTADESAPPTCPHRPSIPTKCFNGHFVELISLGKMMAVWWAGLRLLVSYKISESANAIKTAALFRPLFYWYVM